MTHRTDPLARTVSMSGLVYAPMYIPAGPVTLFSQGTLQTQKQLCIVQRARMPTTLQGVKTDVCI